MTTIEQLVGQFIDDWNAGCRPDVLVFLERAAPQDRDALASQLETWLELAPTPAYDEPTRQSIASEPALLTALDEAAALRAPLAERLPTLRDRAGLAIRDVAARLTQLFNLDDRRAVSAELPRALRSLRAACGRDRRGGARGGLGATRCHAEARWHRGHRPI